MMTSTHGPVIKLALVVLCLAFGVILSVTIIAKETKANVPVIAHATPFAKSSTKALGDNSLAYDIQLSMNKIMPGHQDYDPMYVASLLAITSNKSDEKDD